MQTDSPFRSLSGIGVLWLLVVVLALLTRPLLPVDETRYVAVAWEMWQRGDFLVPYLNGEPYSHKPPLFFWLIHAGWWLFGVSEWWPRCVAALVSLAAILATWHLSRSLWPGDTRAARYAPWVLFGCLFWMAFLSWVQMDMLLVLCVLLALTGVVGVSRGRPAGWLLTGVALGLGGLAKGPVILLHVLPIALLAPIWLQPDAQRNWLVWYAGMLFSVVVGSAIALAWVMPAVGAGGEVYRQAILWSQTADRVISAMAHAHPWWWYLPWLPVLFAPWPLLPWLYRRSAPPPGGRIDAGLCFCLVWLVSVLVVLSLISSKQIKYLLPLLPAFALLIAHRLSKFGAATRAGRPWTMAAVLVMTGGALAALPLLIDTPAWMTRVSPLWGVLLAAGAPGLLVLKPQHRRHYPVLIALLSVWVVGVVHVGVYRTAAPAYDLREVSGLLARAQATGRKVANLARYHGQFHFYGRLEEPVTEIDSDQAMAWVAQHPDGYLVAYYRDDRAEHAGAVFAQAYRGGSLAVWQGTDVAADPGLLH